MCRVACRTPTSIMGASIRPAWRPMTQAGGSRSRSKPPRRQDRRRDGDSRATSDCQDSLLLDHLEGLDDVAHLDVVVPSDPETALEAFLDLAHVVLEALQRVELAGVDDLAVANQAHPVVALDEALHHVAAGDVAELGDLEDLTHLD